MHLALRITVQDVLESLASGMTEDDSRRSLRTDREDIKACLSFTADRERKLSPRREVPAGRKPGGPDFWPLPNLSP